MRRRSLIGFAALLTLGACKGEYAPLGGPVLVETTPSSLTGIVVPSGTQTHAGKVDLLLMIDNSASMGDKQELLRRSIPDLVRRLVAPNCVDTSGRVLGRSNNGTCATGSLEFAPVDDLHVGILTSSLGNRGGDICPEDIIPRTNDRAHLVNLTAAGTPLPSAADGFLRFGPGGNTDPQVLESDISTLIEGVGTTGCGLEAQLESWYRFLVEPDPYADIRLTPERRAELVGTDATIVKQRHDFLRPDSLLSIVVLTDEDDSAADPFALAGQGWIFTAKNFPGSQVFRAGGQGAGTTAPRGTSVCGTDPGSEDCTSCSFASLCDANEASCQKILHDPNCTESPIPGRSGDGIDGYYGPTDDEISTRFFQMKRRYGIDPQYPLERYVHGLLSAKVPSYLTDHDATGKYVSSHECDNPIYAGALPTSPSDELCHLPPGTRSQKLVVLTVIAGAPPELLHPDMTESDWIAVVGKDPIAYDSYGIDPHMVQSTTPRPGLPPPSAADDADPIHGREWDTGKGDLQYACTFALDEPRTCEPSGNCVDCIIGSVNTSGFNDSPACDTTSTPVKQVRAKAYPGIRPLQLARLLGDNAVASSICPLPPASPPSGPVVNYRPAMDQLGDRMARSLLPARK